MKKTLLNPKFWLFMLISAMLAGQFLYVVIV